ncbi:MAG: single-stranded DNA-binding protein [Saprospiraceae bacterium]|nr:MAG: single-stranded DNA-binding protein [Saprospiraceae bacterium]
MDSVRNSITLIGNLGKNPETKTFEEGRTMVKFSMATTEKYRNKEGELTESTQWHNIVAWGKNAENMGKLLKKGKGVVIRGRLVYRSYEDKEGITRYLSEIIANDFALLG